LRIGIDPHHFPAALSFFPIDAASAPQGRKLILARQLPELRSINLFGFRTRYSFFVCGILSHGTALPGGDSWQGLANPFFGRTQ
jgi:hypothetical protein